MTDYGHALLFGSFLSPTAQTPERVVGSTVLSEQLGLDLATFQDHPYRADFLDTWTLLSFLAARTTTIRLAANVANLPLRPPAVLARSVAGLDLLSNGRVELGLGAGAFADAVAAMGGPARTAGQGVTALEEAIAIIRQVWDADAPGGVRVNGAHYRVAGAKRGPRPAHDVGIWLGAYKRRMLALTGRRADGWLPSAAYLEPGLAAGNAVIDDAAQAAGRAPGDIRRLLNIGGRFQPSGRGPLVGPPEQWAEELAHLALTDGVSAFILASDDPDDLRRFAHEVAPAVRELVEDERRTPPPTAGPVSSADPTRHALPVLPTPDDGTRRTGTRVWDESLRPSGPAPDPDTSYDAQQLAAGQQLVDVHDHLRAELAQIQDLVEQVAAGTTGAGAARSLINTLTMRQNKWTLGTYCETYCRIVTTHHTIEDGSMFPQLRRGDARLDPVIDRLEQEHHAIHDVLEGVDRALVAFVAVPTGPTSCAPPSTCSATRCCPTSPTRSASWSSRSPASPPPSSDARRSGGDLQPPARDGAQHRGQRFLERRARVRRSGRPAREDVPVGTDQHRAALVELVGRAPAPGLPGVGDVVRVGADGSGMDSVDGQLQTDPDLGGRRAPGLRSAVDEHRPAARDELDGAEVGAGRAAQADVGGPGARSRGRPVHADRRVAGGRAVVDEPGAR